VSAASLPEWLAAGAVGATTLPLLAAAAFAADHDWHLPHVDVAPAAAAAERAAQWARLHTVALLLLLAWHLEPKEA
jgi:hypothetical protein